MKNSYLISRVSYDLSRMMGVLQNYFTSIIYTGSPIPFLKACVLLRLYFHEKVEGRKESWQKTLNNTLLCLVLWKSQNRNCTILGIFCISYTFPAHVILSLVVGCPGTISKGTNCHSDKCTYSEKWDLRANGCRQDVGEGTNASKRNNGYFLLAILAR